jgi:ATP-dependent helicase HrpA
VPAPDVAAQVLERLEARREPLLDALSREVERLRGVRVPREAWDAARLPAHLRMTFRVEDERGGVVAEGEDLDALREEVRPRLQAALAQASPDLGRNGLRDWTIGTLPRAVALPGSGGALRAYPALVDEGETVGVRAFDTPQEQAEAMRAGTVRLLALTVPLPLRSVQAALPAPTTLALAAAPHGSLRAVVADASEAAIDALVQRHGGPAWDADGFAALRRRVAADLPAAALLVVRRVARILDVAREVRARLDALPGGELAPVREDVARQLGRLVHARMATRAGVGRLPDVERYLRAALRRLERLPDALGADRDRMATVHALEQAHRDLVAARPAGRPLPAQARELPWLLEELRVAQFAQGLGTATPVSAKRVRRAIEEAARAG